MRLQVGAKSATTGHRPGEAPGARIGPNSVLQTLEAARLLHGAQLTERLRDEAGVEEDWPEGLIPEAWFVELIEATRRLLPDATADAILTLSGTRTAEYVATHRIPGLFRGLLATLPTRLALPMLLSAFAKHAWTFAGAGRFDFYGPFPHTLRLQDAPTCRRPRARRSGAYYAAAFEGLLALANPLIRVREVRCQAEGYPHCTFEITVGPPEAETGELKCASF